MEPYKLITKTLKGGTNDFIPGKKYTFRIVSLPAVHNRDDTSFPLCNFHEGGFGHVKMNSWRITPPTIVGGLGPVRRTKISGSDSGVGHIFVTSTRLIALNLETTTARIAIVEQC